MKLIGQIFIGILLLNLIGCTSEKDRGSTNLLGEWTSDLNGNGYVINFTKVDTMITGVITQVPSDSRYSINQVLFKDVKFLNDTTMTCKGLFIKEIDNTTYIWEETGFTFGGDDGHGHIQVPKKFFDHYENIYVDYRLELHNNHKELICKGFSEGDEWKFCKPLSPEEKIRRSDSIEKETRQQVRIQDSIQSVREYFYENGVRKKRDFNPPFLVKFNLIEKRFKGQFETENGSVDEFEYKILPDEKEVYITSVYYRSDGKYDKVMIKDEKSSINFWWDNQLSSDFNSIIKSDEMGDSVKVFNSLKKYLGLKVWEMKDIKERKYQ